MTEPLTNITPALTYGLKELEAAAYLRGWKAARDETRSLVYNECDDGIRVAEMIDELESPTKDEGARFGLAEDEYGNLTA